MRISDWSSDVCSSDLPEAAPCGIAMLGGEQHRAAPFAADRESLDQPQDDERDRGPDTDLGVGGKQSDEDSGDAHLDEAEHPQLLAADAVAAMAEPDHADRSPAEAQRLVSEREQGADHRTELGKEPLVEARTEQLR